jgi:hypothetical protein
MYLCGSVWKLRSLYADFAIIDDVQDYLANDSCNKIKLYIFYNELLFYIISAKHFSFLQADILIKNVIV